MNRPQSHHRTERVSQLVRAALCTALLHETHDDTLQTAVITEVTMTKDLRIAKVYYTSPKVEKEFKAAIEAALPSLRKSIAEHVKLRYVPEIQFHRDTHDEDVRRIYQLLEETHHPKQSEESP